VKSHRIVAALLVIVLGLGISACGERAEDYSDTELHDRLVEVLSEDGTLTTEQADCTVTGLFDNLERDELDDVANAQTESDLTPEQTQLLTQILFSCL
jgi:alpha-L-fucosidase